MLKSYEKYNISKCQVLNRKVFGRIQEENRDQLKGF